MNEQRKRLKVCTGDIRCYGQAQSCSSLVLYSNQNTASLVFILGISQSIMTSQSEQPLLLLSAVCLAISAAVGQGIYNRYFHPLRGQPGPIWASLTDLYKLYALWAKHIPTSQLALHKKYGMLFAFQHTTVIRLLMSVKAPLYAWRQICSP